MKDLIRFFDRARLATMRLNGFNKRTGMTLLISIGIWIGIEGQTRQELERRKEQTIQEIEYSNELLKKAEEGRRSTINRIRIVNRRIELRNEIIETVNRQIEQINSKITENEEIIEQMERDLDKISQEYKELIYYAYWNRNNYNKLMFLLASDNFNQAYKRIKYLQQLTRFRREQAEEIERIKNELKERREELIAVRSEKKGLLSEEISERKQLEGEKYEKGRIAEELARRETHLKRQIKEKEKMADQLAREIAQVIEEERRRAQEENRVRMLTPKEKLISDNFTGNKGRLPWPTERGIITNRFGTHAHPVLKGITIKNDGVDITTVEGAEARCLFNGVVTRVVPVLGQNYAVIVRHGDYLTVYGNLIDITVKKGDNVETRQKLGIVYTDPETGETILHIQIWKEMEKQNPEIWLSSG